MRTPYLIQTAGTVAVAATFAAADLPARLLAATPGSELLWYLQIGVFAPFRQVLNAISFDLSGILSSNLLPLALSVMAFAVVAGATRRRLAVAIMANCSAILVAATAFVWCYQPSAPGQTASLTAMVVGPKMDFALLVILLAVSFVAALASHIAFLREIRGASSTEANSGSARA
jgi:hypothetical protein